MKKKPLYIIFLVWFLISGWNCFFTREQDSLGELQGEWIWIDSYGGIFGLRITPESEGFGPRKLIITDQFMTLYQTDSIIYSTSFKLDERNGRPALIFPGDYPLPMYYEFHYGAKDTLYLIEICEDCFSHRYIKK